MSGDFSRDEIIYVTGYWPLALDGGLNEDDKSRFRSTLKLLAGRKLIAFFEDLEVIEFLRHEAFEYDIELIGSQINSAELPASRYVDKFVKCTLDYGVTQNPNYTAPDHTEKAWCLYWMHFLRYGTEAYRRYLSFKFSKVELAGGWAAEVSNWKKPYFAWVDYDYSKWRMQQGSIFDAPLDLYNEDILHFGGNFNYLGKPMPISSSLLVGEESVWDEMVKIYYAQINKLKRFPYAYDEEVIMSLAKAQHPERLRRFGEKPYFEFIEKTGT